MPKTRAGCKKDTYYDIRHNFKTLQWFSMADMDGLKAEPPARGDEPEEEPASWEIEYVLASLPQAVVVLGREIYRRLKEGAAGLAGAEQEVAEAIREIIAKGAGEAVNAPLFIRQAAVEIVYRRESARFEAELRKMISLGRASPEEAEEARSVHRKIGGVEEINGEAARFIGYFERLAAAGDTAEAGVYVDIARERLKERAPQGSYIRELGAEEAPGSIEEAVLRFIDSEQADKYREFCAGSLRRCRLSGAGKGFNPEFVKKYS